MISLANLSKKSGRTALLAAAVAGLGLLAVAPQAHATTYTWAGPAGSKWDGATSWTSGFPSTAADTATLTATAAGIIDLNSTNQTTGTLAISGGTYTLQNGTLNVNIINGASANNQTFTCAVKDTGGTGLTFGRTKNTDTISGILTVSGNLIVNGNGGTLALNNASDTVAGNIQVNSSGILTLTNIVNTTGGLTVNGGAQVNYNIAGALGSHLLAANGSGSVGQINIGSAVTNAGSDTFNISAGNVLNTAASFSTKLAVGSGANNLTVANNAVLAESAAGKVAATIDTSTLTNNSLYFGVSGTSVTAETVSVGATGTTPWLGISTDRGAATFGGTVNVVSSGSTGSFIFQGLNGSTLTIGTTTISKGGLTSVTAQTSANVKLNSSTSSFNSVNFDVLSGSILEAAVATSMGSGANVATATVESGGVLKASNATAINGNVTVNSGGIFEINAAGITGVGTITHGAGSVIRVDNASSLTGAQLNAGSIAAGEVVQMNVSAISNLASINGGAIYETYNGNQTESASAITLNSNVTGQGVLTNDNSSRTFTSTLGTTIGANGGTIASTTGYTFTVASTINGGANALNIGVGSNVDNLAKAGTVTFSNAVTAGTVTVAAGSVNFNAASNSLGAITSNTSGTVNLSGTTTVTNAITMNTPGSGGPAVLQIQSGNESALLAGTLASNIILNDNTRGELNVTYVDANRKNYGQKIEIAGGTSTDRNLYVTRASGSSTVPVNLNNLYLDNGSVLSINTSNTNVRFSAKLSGNATFLKNSANSSDVDIINLASDTGGTARQLQIGGTGSTTLTTNVYGSISSDVTANIKNASVKFQAGASLAGTINYNDATLGTMTIYAGQDGSTGITGGTINVGNGRTLTSIVDEVASGSLKLNTVGATIAVAHTTTTDAILKADRGADLSSNMGFVRYTNVQPAASAVVDLQAANGEYVLADVAAQGAGATITNSGASGNVLIGNVSTNKLTLGGSNNPQFKLVGTLSADVDINSTSAYAQLTSTTLVVNSGTYTDPVASSFSLGGQNLNVKAGTTTVYVNPGAGNINVNTAGAGALTIYKGADGTTGLGSTTAINVANGRTITGLVNEVTTGNTALTNTIGATINVSGTGTLTADRNTQANVKGTVLFNAVNLASGSTTTLTTTSSAENIALGTVTAAGNATIINSSNNNSAAVSVGALAESGAGGYTVTLRGYQFNLTGANQVGTVQIGDGTNTDTVRITNTATLGSTAFKVRYNSTLQTDIDIAAAGNTVNFADTGAKLQYTFGGTLTAPVVSGTGTVQLLGNTTTTFNSSVTNPGAIQTGADNNLKTTVVNFANGYSDTSSGNLYTFMASNMLTNGYVFTTPTTINATIRPESGTANSAAQGLISNGTTVTINGVLRSSYDDSNGQNIALVTKNSGTINITASSYNRSSLNTGSDKGLVAAGDGTGSVVFDANFKADPNGSMTPVSIVGVNPATKTFSLAGDQTALYVASGKFAVAGSTGNNAAYTISSVTLNGGNTDVVVTQTIPSAIADGTTAFANGDEFYRLYIGNTTVETRSSQSLPIARYRSGNNVANLDGGAIVMGHTISGAAGGTWKVTTNDQTTNAWVPVYGASTIQTDTNLTLTGSFNIYGTTLTLTKTGNGALNINGTQAHNAGSILNVNAGTVNLNTDAGGSITPAMNLTVNVGSVDGTKVGALNLGSNQHIAALNVNGTSTATVSGNGIHVVTNSLAIGGTTDAWTGKLDLNNDMIIQVPVGQDVNAAYDTLVNQLKAGSQGGVWTGTTGVTSTAAANSGYTMGLGAVPNAQLNSFGIGYTTFDGETVDNNSILIKYTMMGDVNLDGTIDSLDYYFIDSAFNNNQVEGNPILTGYINGDFNYDGTIDSADYYFIDSNFNNLNPLPGAAGASPVPEPASLALLGLGTLALLKRRK